MMGGSEVVSFILVIRNDERVGHLNRSANALAIDFYIISNLWPSRSVRVMSLAGYLRCPPTCPCRKAAVKFRELANVTFWW